MNIQSDKIEIQRYIIFFMYFFIFLMLRRAFWCDYLFYCNIFTTFKHFKNHQFTLNHSFISIQLLDRF